MFGLWHAEHVLARVPSWMAPDPGQPLWSEQGLWPTGTLGSAQRCRVYLLGKFLPAGEDPVGSPQSSPSFTLGTPSRSEVDLYGLTHYLHSPLQALSNLVPFLGITMPLLGVPKSCPFYQACSSPPPSQSLSCVYQSTVLHSYIKCFWIS